MRKVVHGEEGLEEGIKIWAGLLRGCVGEVSGREMEEGFKEVGCVEGSGEDRVLMELVVERKIWGWKCHAGEDVRNGGIYVNGEGREVVDYVVREKEGIEGKFRIIGGGKKKYLLIRY